eukprot:11219026-Lingulodinium_polyedra.AAC.1
MAALGICVCGFGHPALHDVCVEYGDPRNLFRAHMDAQHCAMPGALMVTVTQNDGQAPRARMAQAWRASRRRGFG